MRCTCDHTIPPIHGSLEYIAVTVPQFASNLSLVISSRCKCHSGVEGCRTDGQSPCNYASSINGLSILYSYSLPLMPLGPSRN